MGERAGSGRNDSRQALLSFRRRNGWTWRFKVKFVPRDFWIGVFFDKPKEHLDEVSGDWVQRTYIVVVPMFPVIVERWYPGDWWATE